MSGEQGDDTRVGLDVTGDDHLYFYADRLDDSTSNREAALVSSLLDLRPGERLLDLPCGHGRITVPLALHGIDVTGVDLSTQSLALAEARAREAGVGTSCTFVTGDMRTYRGERPYDAAMSWFTSFGYFDEAGNTAVLERLLEALRPGGKLLVEMLNRDLVVRQLSGRDSHTTVRERDGNLLVDQLTFDAVEGRAETRRFVARDGRVHRSEFSIRMPSGSELTATLKQVGFCDIEVFDEDGAPFSVDATRMVCRARRR